jgi:hypothetical protein
MDVRVWLIVERAVTIEVVLVVIVPVYDDVVMVLVVVSVVVPVKLVAVVDKTELLSFGETIVAVEWCRQENKVIIATKDKRKLETCRDALN